MFSLIIAKKGAKRNKISATRFRDSRKKSFVGSVDRRPTPAQVRRLALSALHLHPHLAFLPLLCRHEVLLHL